MDKEKVKINIIIATTFNDYMHSSPNYICHARDMGALNIGL